MIIYSIQQLRFLPSIDFYAAPCDSVKNRLEGLACVSFAYLSSFESCRKLKFKADFLTDCKASLSNCHYFKEQAFSEASGFLAAFVLKEQQNKTKKKTMVHYISYSMLLTAVAAHFNGNVLKSTRPAKSYITVLKLVIFSYCMFWQILWHVRNKI